MAISLVVRLVAGLSSMSGIFSSKALSVKVNGRTDEALRKLYRELSNKRQANRQLAVQLQGRVMKTFATEGAYRGERWKDLKLKGRWRKKRGKRVFQTWYKILQDTGNLRQSFAPFHDEAQAGVGARAAMNVDYAKVHEEGDPSRNLPARPMLPTTEQALQDAFAVYNNHIAQARAKAEL